MISRRSTRSAVLKVGALEVFYPVAKNNRRAPGRASSVWRRRAGSNRCIAVLQTAPLPLGYGAPEGDIIVASFSGTQHKTHPPVIDDGLISRRLESFL